MIPSPSTIGQIQANLHDILSLYAIALHLNYYRLASHNFNSVQFSGSVVSDSLWPHGLQHIRLPCPSQVPGVYSNSCHLSWWYHPTISSSVIPFSSHLQTFPASGSFPMSQFFPSGGQSVGVSASASVLPINIQDQFPLGWTGWIPLHSKGLSRVFNITVQKNQQSYSLFCPFSLDAGLCYISLWLCGFLSIDDSCTSTATFCTCRFTCLPYSYSLLKWSYSEYLLYYPKYSVSLLL